ncbi:MAG: ABC transporter permease subunit [Gammaproteobacteria bacterium]|nr:ABC transporter permease subunit [Gammaproteobacteria bacterium]MDH5800872.1 ABC transporter permease subunit [Gammaproteobacteria bacterium]
MNSDSPTSHSSSLQLGRAEKLRRWRYIKDIIARYSVGIGGISVIIAIVLIFFYLLYVVFPLFLPASLQKEAEYSVPGGDKGASVLLAMEEQNEIGVRFTNQGYAIFFDARKGSSIRTDRIETPKDAVLTSFTQGDPTKGTVAYGTSSGHVIVAQHKYKVSYPNNVRRIDPELIFPLGPDPLLVDEQEREISQIAVKLGEESSTIVALTVDDRLIITSFAKEENLFEAEESDSTKTQAVIELKVENIEFLLLDKEQRTVYLANAKGELSAYDISDKEFPTLLQHTNILGKGQLLTRLEFLTGDISLLAGDSAGYISQWSPVRNASNKPELRKFRSFHEREAAVHSVVSEYSRKGFVVLDENGYLGVYHSTAERVLLLEPVTSKPRAVSLAPRANALLVEGGEEGSEKLNFFALVNEHPEVSWSSLWGKVWYENYPEEQYIWQSSSASNDFEPKFSLTPLVFGTLKAAFYAMLIAIPLAIMGAIYTAYFMAPRMRRMVKPGIEIMEALPTVILGFLAGLWLAPLVETHLSGIFTLLLVMPMAILAFAYSWQHVPEKYRHAIPEGWDAALLIPVIIVVGWLSFAMSQPIENLLFSGDMRVWLKDAGIDFDQRNSLVVGIAMGFAVIPTIFSIAEDAIFSVPKHLTYGSLALGATPWQTMVRVVLLTASPGIFSAVMIGFGRAVGETMIVLMATGNTPVMDLSIFQGMRTLSANIAVEMPESEVDSTHYRVLFLAALVLFMFTFIFNTVAELVRQRLREKYSSL